MNFRTCLCCLVLIVAGCSNEASRELLAEKENQLARMQQRLVEVQEESSQVQFSLDREVTEIKETYLEETEQQTKLIELLRSQVDKLRAENRALLLELSNIQAEQATPQIASAPPPPVPLAQLEEAAQEVTINLPDGDEFPVEIKTATGRKVVTGSHTVSRFKENGEEIKDKFGRWRADGDWEQEPVYQYGYEVEFSIHNPSDKARQVTARAGLISQNFNLKAGETKEGIKLVAARGSSLWLLSEGRSLKVDVVYDETAPVLVP